MTDFANEAANLAGYPNSSRAAPDANCNSMSCDAEAEILSAGYENGGNEDYHVEVNSNPKETAKSTKLRIRRMICPTILRSLLFLTRKIVLTVIEIPLSKTELVDLESW